MDLASVAAIAAPFVAKGVEAFSKTAGDRLAGKAADLLQAVTVKFKGDTYAEQTLARAGEAPESDDRQAALKGILADKMKEDPGFAKEIEKLLDEMKGEASSNCTIFDQRGQNVGSQTNIGSVKGSVNIGTK
jgi:hypothetical protein